MSRRVRSLWVRTFLALGAFAMVAGTTQELWGQTYALVLHRGTDPYYPWICNLDGSGAEQLSSARLATAPRFRAGVVAFYSPDVAGQGVGIYTMAATPGAPVTKIPGSEVTQDWNDLAISPDGTRIAYAGANPGDGYQNHDIYVQNLDGTDRVRINRNTSYHFFHFDWAETNRILFIRSNVGNPYTQYPHKISPDGTNLLQFNSNFTQYPASSGAGGAIVASQGYGGAEHLVVFDSNFGNPRSIPNANHFRYPKWHPTENAVLAVNSDTYDVYKINVETGAQTRITNFGDVRALDCGTRPTSSSDPGQTSKLALVSGTVAGQAISPSSRTVTVTPGQSLVGQINVRIDSTWPSNAVMAMGITPSWGSHATSYTDVGGFATPVSGLTRTVPINLTAPTTPGTYYITSAYRGEFTAAQVMSCTNWSAGAGTWNDGNDVADWTAPMIAAANANGTVQASVLYPSGFASYYVPATTITVIVQAPTTCSSFTISPSSASPGDQAGSTTVSLTGSPSGCQGGSWAASGNGSWLTVSPTVGTGPGNVTVSWSANTAASQRSGTATIAGRTFSVSQGSPASGGELAAGSGNVCSGESVTVPVTLTGTAIPLSIQFDATFDPAKLSVTSVTVGSLTTGFSVSSNGTTGRVRVAMASGSGASAPSGEAARITFQATSALGQGGSAIVGIENVTVNDIAGTGSSGTLTCSSCRKGDVNGNGNVSAYDASLVLQAVVGAISLDSSQACAADFNTSGAVTAYDAALILGCVVNGNCP